MSAAEIGGPGSGSAVEGRYRLIIAGVPFEFGTTGCAVLKMEPSPLELAISFVMEHIDVFLAGRHGTLATITTDRTVVATPDLDRDVRIAGQFRSN
jgi:hypothetical protein